MKYSNDSTIPRKGLIFALAVVLMLLMFSKCAIGQTYAIKPQHLVYKIYISEGVKPVLVLKGDTLIVYDSLAAIKTLVKEHLECKDELRRTSEIVAFLYESNKLQMEITNCLTVNGAVWDEKRYKKAIDNYVEYLKNIK